MEVVEAGFLLALAQDITEVLMVVDTMETPITDTGEDLITATTHIEDTDTDIDAQIVGDTIDEGTTDAPQDE